MGAVSTVRCPICAKQFDPNEARAMPFCSERCRQIDLGRWLREAYSVPIESHPKEESENASEKP
jgi:hypothetical protein